MLISVETKKRIRFETFNLLPPVLMNSILAKDMVTMALQFSPASPTYDLYKIYVVSHRD